MNSSEQATADSISVPDGEADSATPVEKPANGLAGLKHWRFDLRSGFMVAMISLPFSMGIAITSGAPPVCGIMSAIIAGFLLPFLGGSYVTISGPAAGLAPALYGGMVALGHGDLAAGYPMVLVAILIAGLAQIILAALKVARLSAIFPAAAIEGMLAAIGLLIIAKQIPLFLGVKFEAHDFWTILIETPSHFADMNLAVLGLGAGSLVLLFVLAALPSRLLKVMPPPVWVFVGGTIIATLVLNLDTKYLIDVPEAPLANGVVMPDFAGVWNDHSVWLPFFVLIVTLLFIDGTESLATIMAVDKIDPYKRRSDPDRTLNAMGVSNCASSLLGGLTIIPGIVKSTANILGGGRTQWANFYNACFLLTFLLVARELINLVPLSILAAILVFIGFKLCRPKVWAHAYHIGKEQFVIFAATVVITVTTDLLIGIFCGIVLKWLLTLWYSWTRDTHERGLLTHAGLLFRDPITQRELDGEVYTMHATRPLACFNLVHLFRELREIPKEARSVKLVLEDGVTVVDHTTSEVLLSTVDEHKADKNKPSFVIEGLDGMDRLSQHEASVRLATATTTD
jgi:carbonic anhydrase